MQIISVLYAFVFITLSFIGVLSFTLFIKRLLVNATLRNKHALEIELKLDRIIDLLEKETK